MISTKLEEFQKEYLVEVARRLFSKTKYWIDEKGKQHLLWTGAVSGQGYGYISFWYKSTRVHRVVWELVYDKPKSLHVLHNCDIRTCVEIKHLFLGTDSDNKDDMFNKKRNPIINELGQFMKRQDL